MLIINPQCEWGGRSQWLDNGLIEVDLMPTLADEITPLLGM